MNITDHLDRAIDAAPGPDLARLSRVAVTQGTRARRRRRSGIVAGSVLAVALVGLAVTTLPGSPAVQTPIASDGPAPSAEVVPSAGPSATITDRGAVAALRDLVTQLVPGTTDAYAGQGNAPGMTPYHEMFATLALRPTGDPGATIIGINIAPPEPGAARGCAESTPRPVDCSDVTLADGSRLLSYEIREEAVGGVGISRVVTLIRPSGDTVALTATNGYDGQRGVWTITRPEPSLTLEQVRELATQPLWFEDFPAAYVDQGATLAPWQDLNSEPGTF